MGTILASPAGEYDEATPISLGEELAAGVPNGRFVTIEQSAHLPPAEQPAAVAKLLITFLLPPDRRPVE